jgi:radical SAM protein (TIGR01212 family)
MPRYNSFGSYVKRTFGTTVHKVNIDAGFTCPNRDGTVGVGGCIYCNNKSFKPDACKSAVPVREQIQNGRAYVQKRYGAKKLLAYFQPYTNTHAPVDRLKSLYLEALEEPLVMGLAIGTRPDCVDEEKLDMIAKLAEDHFILVEYGLQSIYEKTLRFINRGHDLATFLRAIELTRQRSIHTGAHVIVGFPSETEDEMLEMATEVSDTGIEFLKIHQLQVIKETPLASIYEEEDFNVFGYEEYIDFVVRFIERLSPGIVLQRLFASAPDEMLIAPRWNRTRNEILKDIESRFIKADSFQGKLYKAYTKV